ncbi:chromosome condensation condensin complex [Tubulinosema ratisbonensis]|uniref:Chromosome condensation condensin complex n=1 Tax=Tubulinosema ratisbonensis TaxID=291195 RepID=A0A437ANU3_9MICR|nr:chromosome condensation condensin complex [Tubulinosema ratisbonensis]
MLKELLKHDPNSEVRKEALRVLEIKKENIPALISRSADIVPSVRKYFYENVLQFITVKSLEKEHKVFLLKASFTDRSSCFKNLFIKKIREEYSNNCILIINDFYDEIILEEIKELLCNFYDELELRFDEEFLKSMDFYSSFLVKEYLCFLENKFGRDTLDLPPLKLFLEFLYKKMIVIFTYKYETGYPFIFD